MLRTEVPTRTPDGAARAVFDLVRPGNCVMTSVGIAAGALVAAGAALPSLWLTAGLGALTGFAFAGAGNALNDYVDRDLDRKAHPERPIPSGRLSPRAALRAQGLLFALAVALAGAISWIHASPLALLLVLPALALMLSYELALKARGLSGNIAISLLTGAPFVMGGISADAVTPAVLLLAALAFPVNLGREIVKDIEDVAADRGSRVTLPMRIGERRARLAAQAAILAGVALSPLPYVLGHSGIAYIPLVMAADTCLILAAWGAKTPSRASRLAKLGMLVGLGAFIGGSLA